MTMVTEAKAVTCQMSMSASTGRAMSSATVPTLLAAISARAMKDTLEMGSNVKVCQSQICYLLSIYSLASLFELPTHFVSSFT